MLKMIRRIVLYLLIFILASFLCWAGYMVSQGHDAAILMYHSVGENFDKPGTLNVSECVFEKQMKFLHDNNYHVISLPELARLLKTRARVPFKTVVLTFDDGYENNYTHAYPILKKYNFPATIFVIAGHVGQKKEEYGQQFQFLSSEQLKEMALSGLITIGAHTKDHVYLPKEHDEAALWGQIHGAKIELEKIIGRPVEVFCYPTGGYTAHIQELIARAGYQAAVTTLPRHQGFAHRDIYALKRIKMSENDQNFFKLFVMTSGYYLRMKEMSH